MKGMQRILADVYKKRGSVRGRGGLGFTPGAVGKKLAQREKRKKYLK
jgi:NADH:ubiquinone oxidoreductase subunit F (NADH-binding)